MKSKTVNLPELVRMPESMGGHVLYEPGPTSICPNHQFCAYTGDEPGRCPACHGRYDADGICPCQELPPGRHSPCLCARCRELFTSLTAFERHMPGGVCKNPAKRGLVLVEQNGWKLWANPGTPPSRD
jgi:hypothetical protein